MNYFDKRPVSFDKRIISRFKFWEKVFVEFCCDKFYLFLLSFFNSKFRKKNI